MGPTLQGCSISLYAAAAAAAREPEDPGCAVGLAALVETHHPKPYLQHHSMSQLLAISKPHLVRLMRKAIALTVNTLRWKLLEQDQNSSGGFLN